MTFSNKSPKCVGVLTPSGARGLLRYQLSGFISTIWKKGSQVHHASDIKVWSFPRDSSSTSSQRLTDNKAGLKGKSRIETAGSRSSECYICQYQSFLTRKNCRSKPRLRLEARILCAKWVWRLSVPKNLVRRYHLVWHTRMNIFIPYTCLDPRKKRKT